MKARACLAVLIPLVLATPEALGLGADHSPGPLGPNPAWPRGFLELVNRAERAHGFFVNATDVFYYSGDTQALNQFLEAYARLPGASLKVIIHPGAKNASSPWDKRDNRERNLPIQWSLRSVIGGDNEADVKAGRLSTYVDLWLGSRIRLEDVRIPANVEAASGGEIERFVADRQKELKKPQD
jgi:hypothetical protein